MEEQGQGNNCFRRKVGKRGAATSADELRDIQERRAAVQRGEFLNLEELDRELGL
jgi:hypothetical protein